MDESQYFYTGVFFVLMCYENVFVNSNKKTMFIYKLYILLYLIIKQTNYEQLPS